MAANPNPWRLQRENEPDNEYLIFLGQVKAANSGIYNSTEVENLDKAITNLNNKLGVTQEKLAKASEEQSKLWTFLERNFKKGTDAIKNYRDAAHKMRKDPAGAMMALAQEGLDYLQREADVREHIIETINSTEVATKMMTRNLMEAELETLKWGATSEDLAK